MGKIKLLVSANNKGLVLIYDTERKKYDIWFNGNLINKGIAGKRPNNTLIQMLSIPKNQFETKINDFPDEIKEIYNSIISLNIDSKANDFVLKDCISQLNSYKENQEKYFDDLDNGIKLQYFNEEQLKNQYKTNDSIHTDIIITNKIDKYYLAYIKYSNEYILFNFANKNFDKEIRFTIKENPNELSNILDDIIEENPNYQFQDIKHNGLKEILHSLQNDKNTFFRLINDLYDVYYLSFEENKNAYRDDRLNNITDGSVIETLKAETEEILNNKEEYIEALIMSLVMEIEECFNSKEKKLIEKGIQSLSTLLTLKYGVILRKYIGTIYKRSDNGYEPTSHDDLIIELVSLFEPNFIHDSYLKKAIGYISDRLEPVPNKIKFENTLFDMETVEPIESEKPIFTVLNIPYKYNPNAKSKLMKDFLYSSFKRIDKNGNELKEETEKAVKGIKQLTGYFFTSGNSKQILPIFTGLTGAGKSTFLNILTGIFGKDKISGISLQSLENNIHASSGFIGKHLNMIRDSDNSMIKNNTILKNISGDEPISVNPKYKDLFDLPADEVPKSILACNTMPVFQKYDKAVIRRLVIVEFLISMTKENKAIEDLDKMILADSEEVEWFIYESLQAYKEMEQNNERLIFKITDEETEKLIEKHTHPMNHIIQKLILKHDPIAYDSEKFDEKNFKPIFTDDLVKAILFVSDREGIDVPTNKHGKIDKKKLLNVIRDEFDLHDGEIVKNNRTGKYENHRDYTARSERFNGVNKKAYPNLIAKEEYINILNEIEKRDKGNNKTKK